MASFQKNLAAVGCFLFVSSAFAEVSVGPRQKGGGTKNRDFSLDISGIVAFNSTFSNQKDKEKAHCRAPGGHFSFDKVRDRQSMFSLDDSRLFFQVSKPLDSKTTVRALVGLNGDRSNSNHIRQAWVEFVHADWGRIRGGNCYGPSDYLAVGGFSVLGGGGGFDGGFTRSVAFPHGVHIGSDLIGETKVSTKIALESPRVTLDSTEVQLAASYTPSTAHEGERKLDSSAGKDASHIETPYFTDVTELVLRVKQSIRPGFSVTGTASSLLGNTRPASKRKLAGEGLTYWPAKAFSFGVLVKYDKFSFGAEYTSNGRSGRLRTPFQGVVPGNMAGFEAKTYDPKKARAPEVFNIGVGYKVKDTEFAAGYFRSHQKTGWEKDRAQANVYSFTVDQKIQTGVGVYGEINLFSAKNPSASYELDAIARRYKSGEASDPVGFGPMGKQKGTSFTAGARIVF